MTPSLALLLLVPAVFAGSAPAPPARSVYEVRPAVDYPVTLIAGGGALAATLFGGGLVDKRCPCDPGEVDAFDRPAIGYHSRAAQYLSDAAVAAAVAGPPLADWLDLGWGQAYREDLTVFAEALAVNGALVTAVKYAVQRPSPEAYAGEPRAVGRAQGYLSFYSGHAATAAAALTAAAQTARLRHHAGWTPWLLAVAASAGIGAARVAAGTHFYSDVAVGVVAGTVVGTAVPWVHERPGAGTLTLLPRRGGAALVWRRRF